MKNSIKWIIAVLLAIAIFFIGFAYFEAFSAFFASILIIIGAFGLLFTVDKYLITGFDLIEELKKQNIAVGLAFVGYCILIGLCIVGSFVVYR